MAFNYRIQSILISPGGYLFETTNTDLFAEKITLTSPKEHGKTEHIATYECVADNIHSAWKEYYEYVSSLIEAISFHTSSYLAFHDWNHIIINIDQKVALVAHFERTFGTPLALYFGDDVDDVKSILNACKTDVRLANFLHCYRMAVLVDAPETQDAYEKYLILACEALAGEIDDDNGYSKIDRKRLEKIIGKELHKYFFSSVDESTGKTIRNANMHNGKSPNQKPSKTLELVNRLREFIKNEYSLKALRIIDEKHSPTRGLYRDDGGLVMLSGDGVMNLDLANITSLINLMKDLPGDIEVLHDKGSKDAIANM